MSFFRKEKINNKRIIHIGPLKISYHKHPIKTLCLSLHLKQDKNSEIEFYLIDAFEIYHFLPIYNELLSLGIRTRIIAEPCEINSVGSWFDYNTAIKILKELNIDYCTKCNPNAKIAITTQKAFYDLKKYHNKKAVLAYGVGLNYNAFGLSKATCIDCNMRFVHGEFQKNILSKFMDENKIYIIGYPKHDNFFKNLPNKEVIKKELNISTSKPILVYFPTWDEDSSIKTFSKAINKLRKKYFVVTKAHHCTFRLPAKKDDLNILYQISDIVLEGNFSFEKAAMLADVTLIDAKSGALTEVPFLNSKASKIALSVQNDMKNYFHEELFKFINIINSPEELTASIFNKEFTPKIKITDFYTSTYGNDAQVICQILLKEIKDGA